MKRTREPETKQADAAAAADAAQAVESIKRVRNAAPERSSPHLAAGFAAAPARGWLGATRRVPDDYQHTLKLWLHVVEVFGLPQYLAVAHAVCRYLMHAWDVRLHAAAKLVVHDLTREPVTAEHVTTVDPAGVPEALEWLAAVDTLWCEPDAPAVYYLHPELAARLVARLRGLGPWIARERRLAVQREVDARHLCPRHGCRARPLRQHALDSLADETLQVQRLYGLTDEEAQAAGMVCGFRDTETDPTCGMALLLHYPSGARAVAAVPVYRADVYRPWPRLGAALPDRGVRVPAVYVPEDAAVPGWRVQACLQGWNDTRGLWREHLAQVERFVAAMPPRTKEVPYRAPLPALDAAHRADLVTLRGRRFLPVKFGEGCREKVAQHQWAIAARVFRAGGLGLVESPVASGKTLVGILVMIYVTNSLWNVSAPRQSGGRVLVVTYGRQGLYDWWDDLLRWSDVRTRRGHVPSVGSTHASPYDVLLVDAERAPRTATDVAGAQVVLVTYRWLLERASHGARDEALRTGWDLVVLDEAGIRSYADALQHLRGRARRVLALTATPLDADEICHNIRVAVGQPRADVPRANVPVAHLLEARVINPYRVCYERVANRLADVGVDPEAWNHGALRQLERFNPCVLQALLARIGRVWRDPHRVCKAMLHFEHLCYLDLVFWLVSHRLPHVAVLKLNGESPAAERDAAKVLLDHPTRPVVVLSTVSSMGANYIRLWHLVQAELFASVENRQAVQVFGRALRRVHCGQKPVSEFAFIATDPAGSSRMKQAVERYVQDHRRSLVEYGFLAPDHPFGKSDAVPPATADGWATVFGADGWRRIQDTVRTEVARLRNA